jgi:purine-binding chemotaxis protein CheW
MHDRKRPSDESGKETTRARPHDGRLSYLTLFIGEDEYALPLYRVQEIAPLDSLTRVATAPAFVLGLLDLNGSAVPVIDVARKFDAHRAPASRYRSIVIIPTHIKKQLVLIGLVIDRLGRIVHIASELVRPPPPLDAIITVEFLTGVFESENHFVLCIDVDHLLGAEEYVQISGLLQDAKPLKSPDKAITPKPFLAVRMAGERCVLHLSRLHEILECGRISRIPGAAPFVLGATNIRGSILPVLDLSLRCGLAQARGKHDVAVVVVDAGDAADETLAGLVVESIDGVVHVLPDQINNTPPFGTRFPPDWVEGMVPITNEFVPILDVARSLSPGAGHATPGA